MDMHYNLIGIALFISFTINIYLIAHKPNLSAESGLSRLKTSLIKMMVFYQDKYNGSDQLVFMAKWIQQVKDKIKLAPKEQKDLFKEIVNGL